MWKDIISSLIESGLTQQQIADEVGISQAHVSDLASGRRGKRLGYEIGQKLLRLHQRRRRHKQAASSACAATADSAERLS